MVKSEMTAGTVTIGQWTGPIEVAAKLMDETLREAIHNEMAPCDAQAFADEYCRRHLEQFGERFVVNLGVRS